MASRWLSEQVNKLADALEPRVFEEGDYIIRQGAPEDVVAYIPTLSFDWSIDSGSYSFVLSVGWFKSIVVVALILPPIVVLTGYQTRVVYMVGFLACPIFLLRFP